MVVAEKEKKRLLEDRAGIKSHMKSLLKSLDTFDVTSALIKDNLWCYRQRLYDFRDAIQVHLELDDIILSRMTRGRSSSRITKEREKVLGLVMRAIELTNMVVESTLSPAETARFARNIREISGMIYRVIEMHATAEDKLLSQTSPKK
jgi:hypothetical protein